MSWLYQPLLPGAAALSGGAASFLSAWTINCNAQVEIMRKNVASQRVGAQLVSATDGSAFTGAVTVAVTVDAGTQGTGSVGSGACTHEGGGYHTYAPAQAETNGDLIAFTFTGTGAVPSTVQVYTRDNAELAIAATGTLSGTHSSTTADLGANAPTQNIAGMILSVPSRNVARYVDSYDTGTGVATFSPSTAETLTNADPWLLFQTPPASTGAPPAVNLVQIGGTTTNVAALATNVDAILTDTAVIGAAGAGLTALATQASVNTIDGIVDDILVDTAVIGAGGAGLTALATAANLSTVAGYLDTEVAAILAAVDTEVAAIKTKTDFLPSATAGAAGGVFIAGSNAATTVNITGNVTGNLSGSVGSVTGAVGSVTGLTAADVAAIKAKTDSLTFTVAGQVDANSRRIAGTTVLGNGTAGNKWRG